MPSPVWLISKRYKWVPCQIGLFHFVIQCLSAEIGVSGNTGESGATVITVIYQWVCTQLEDPHLLLIYLSHWQFRWDRTKRTSSQSSLFLFISCTINFRISIYLVQGSSYKSSEKTFSTFVHFYCLDKLSRKMAYQCITCKKFVNKRREALLCNGCNSGVSWETYRDAVGSGEDIPWKCESCSASRASLPNLESMQPSTA